MEKMVPTVERVRSSTPLLDEKTPDAPPEIPSLKRLLPSMPSLGEISAFSHSCPNEVYLHAAMSTPNHDIIDNANMDTVQISSQNDSPGQIVIPTPVVKALSGTNLVPSKTLVQTDDKGNLKTFSNIKAPPLLERKPFKCDKCPKRLPI